MRTDGLPIWKDSRLYKHPGVCHNQLNAINKRSRQTEISTQTKISKPPTAQNYRCFNQMGKFKPLRAHNLIESDVRKIDGGNGLKFDQGRSKLQNFESPTTHPLSPRLNFNFRHQFVKNPMILCNTPLLFVVEYELESPLTKWPSIESKSRRRALEKWYNLKPGHNSQSELRETPGVWNSLTVPQSRAR